MRDITEDLIALAERCINADEREAVLDAASTIISSRQSLAGARARKEKHAEIIPRCAAARDEVELFNRQAAEANGMVASIAADLHRARMALSQHLARRPRADNYPTKGELDKFEKERAHLLAAVAAAEEASRNHSASQAAIRQAGFEALNKFHQLAAQERALRPAEAAASA